MNKSPKNYLKAVLIIFCVSLIVSCNPKPTKEIVTIPEGKVGLIGFGSLTSSKAMTRKLGKPYVGEVRVVHLNGFQRYWDIIIPNDLSHGPINSVFRCLINGDTIAPQNGIWLNIREVENKSMNCVFFILDESGVLEIDKTETGYKRIDVSNSIGEFNVVGGAVYAYQALPSYTKEPLINRPDVNVVLSRYLNTLEAGFNELGEEYRREFYESTVMYHESLVLDCNREWQVP